MWKVTEKGKEETKEIFRIADPLKKDVSIFDQANENNELDYFKDSVKVEVISLSDSIKNSKKDQTDVDNSFDTYNSNNNENDDVVSIQSVS